MFLWMWAWFVWLVILVVAVRAVLLYVPHARRYAENFDGVVYRVGRAVVAERNSVDPRATVICMHGLFEDQRYFTRFYSDARVQLILLTSGGYHLPIAHPRFRSADWAHAPAAALGTIEYDAAVLVQALEHLPRTDKIRVHGHSRGGAVTLEAAAMRPDLFRGVEVLLEAPVVPQSRPRRPLPRATLWFLPFVLALWRRAPISPYNRRLWGRLDDPRKRELIAGLPFSIGRAATALRNVKSLHDWMEQRRYALYDNVERGSVIVPDSDAILDPESVRASAAYARGLRTVSVPDCSHFVLLDRPDVFAALTNSVPVANP